MREPSAAFDSAKFRQVLGHFPTGVTVVTSADDQGPVGLAVGSFASASLDPPLVCFFPNKVSSSWPRIEAAGTFCINILTDDQEEVSRRFAARAKDKFVGLGWKPTGSGAPLLDGVLAWIDCDVHSVADAGDHFCVMGRVRDLGVSRAGSPLLFFRGGYGRFTV